MLKEFRKANAPEETEESKMPGKSYNVDLRLPVPETKHGKVPQAVKKGKQMKKDTQLWARKHLPPKVVSEEGKTIAYMERGRLSGDDKFYLAIGHGENVEIKRGQYSVLVKRPNDGVLHIAHIKRVRAELAASGDHLRVFTDEVLDALAQDIYNYLEHYEEEEEILCMTFQWTKRHGLLPEQCTPLCEKSPIFKAAWRALEMEIEKNLATQCLTNGYNAMFGKFVLNSKHNWTEKVKNEGETTITVRIKE